MNLPNVLTSIRLLLVPIYISFLPDVVNKLFFSLVILALGGFLDIADGYIARKYNLITDFGKMMDPLADKLLLITIAGGLWLNGYIPFWILVFMAIREGVMIAGGAISYLYKKIAIPANALGKINTCYIYMLIISYILQWEIRSLLARGFVLLVLVTTIVYSNIFINKLFDKKTMVN